MLDKIFLESKPLNRQELEEALHFVYFPLDYHYLLGRVSRRQMVVVGAGLAGTCRDLPGTSQPGTAEPSWLKAGRRRRAG